MSVLSQLLERLRRVQLAPGVPAGVVGVPSAAADLSGEVAFMFDRLDAIDDRRDDLLAAARADAAQRVAVAEEQRRSIMVDAAREAERIAAGILAERSAATEDRGAAMLAEARREAEVIRARGRERTPGLVREAVAALLEDGR